MTRRVVLCEGPDDLNALRAIAQHLRWSEPARAGVAGAGHERVVWLRTGDVRIEITVPSKSRGASGEGKSALAQGVAEALRELPSQIGPPDESTLSLASVVFDPDDQPVSAFHVEIERAIRERATTWSLAPGGAPGLWSATREAGETVEVRAVHWRAPGEQLDGLPDHENLERLLCAVLAKAYPDDRDHMARWLTEMGERRRSAGRKAASWKAAIHVWLACVYDKADELNAASRFLHQQAECKPHITPLLTDTGLLADLRPLLGPA